MCKKDQPVCSRSLLVPVLAGVLLSLACDGPTKPPILTSIEVTPISLSFTAVGDTATLSAVARDENRNRMSGVSFTWSSSANSVATVSSAGVVTAAGNGEATIRASAAGVTSNDVSVTVETFTSIEVFPSSAELGMGQTQEFVALALLNGVRVPWPGATASWTSSDESVATIAPTGDSTALVTAVAPGTTEIQAVLGEVTSPVATLVVIDVGPASAAAVINAAFSTVSASSADLVIDVVALDQNGNKVSGLPASAYSIPSVFFRGTRLSFAVTAVTSGTNPFSGSFSAGLVIDQSGSMRNNDPNNARYTAVKQFTREMVSGDEVMLYTFASQVVRETDFTSSPTGLDAAVDALPSASGGTALYDAGIVACNFVQANATNVNQAVVLLTDGRNNASFNSIDDLITLCGGSQTAPSISSISPSPLVEGQTATVSGNGFSTVVTENLVFVDGARATVTAATANSLTITIPSFDCRPARHVTVQVLVARSRGTNGVKVFTVGFGNAQASTLARIAAETGGVAFADPDVGALLSAFRGAPDILRGNTVPDRLGVSVSSGSAALPGGGTVTATLNVDLGDGKSVSVPFQVTLPGTGQQPLRPESFVDLALAASDIRSDAALVGCVQFPAQSGASSFLVVPAVATGTSGVIASERITRTVGSSTIFGTGGFNIATSSTPSRQRRAGSNAQRLRLELHREFESRLREYERQLMRARGHEARTAFGAGAMQLSRNASRAAIAVGDTITLKVPTSCTAANTITAVIRAEGTFAIAVEDTEAPAGGFTDADYAAIVAEFDSDIYPTDILYFGSPSDLDSNGKIFLVYTPQVNKLTPPGTAETQGFVTGFFFAVDMFPLATCPASNVGEFFYSLVPDPAPNVFGNDFMTSFVRQVTRGTAAHEFQHLINAATRIFGPGGGTEEIWLNEGLSHLAEEVVGHAVTGLTPGSNLTFATAAANIDDFNAFYNSNFGRLKRYLAAPDASSPIDADDDLATRGAIWSFLRWILDQEATPATEASITRAMVATSLSGVANIESAVAKNFEDLLPEWLLALFADDFVAGVAARLTIPSWEMRDIYANLSGAYPLATTSLGYVDGITNFTVRSGSGRYFLLSSGAASPAMSMRLTNQADSPLDPSLLPRILLLRLQ